MRLQRQYIIAGVVAAGAVLIGGRLVAIGLSSSKGETFLLVHQPRPSFRRHNDVLLAPISFTA